MNLYFIMQVIRLFQSKNFTENELRMAYDYLITIDNDVLNLYINSVEDIEVYTIALNLILDIYIKREEYEKCNMIKNKIDSANNIINENVIIKTK
jgi:hypothetical protein